MRGRYDWPSPMHLQDFLWSDTVPSTTPEDLYRHTSSLVLGPTSRLELRAHIRRESLLSQGYHSLRHALLLLMLPLVAHVSVTARPDRCSSPSYELCAGRSHHQWYLPLIRAKIDHRSHEYRQCTN